MESAGDSPLTDEAFWDAFWNALPIPDLVDQRKVFDRCLSRALGQLVPQGGAISVAEVGCAPGRWLIYCAQTFGASVTGFEFAPAALNKTRQNLSMAGVSATLVEGDFMTLPLPEASQDVVLSLGFIEHFREPGPVFERHVRLLKPGGLLFLEVPNLRGLHGLFMKWTQPTLLADHNLDLMVPAAMARLAAEEGLETVRLGFMGNFEPALFNTTKASRTVRLVIGAMGRIRGVAPWLDPINSSLLSAYLLGVFRKPGSPQADPV